MTMSDSCACGGTCCSGIRRTTPVPLANRPGLAEIAYRTGTWASFRDGMIAGLTRADRPALAGLTTRDPGDLSLALIDAWAAAADVLTFYTERAANEHYLGTATERRSVAGLVGLLGYRLGPGVAARTDLAFTLDTSPGSPTAVPIPGSAKVQTVPGPGQVPQTFETGAELTALADWNTLQPRRTEPRLPRVGDRSILLVGAATGVVRGDTLLVLGDAPSAKEGFVTVRVTAVRPDPGRGTTEIEYAGARGTLGATKAMRVFVLRTRAALFGYNAASPSLFTAEVRTGLGDQVIDVDPHPRRVAWDWAFAELSPGAVDLAAVHEGLVEGSPVLLREGATTVLAFIDAVFEAGRTAYGISATVTRLALSVAATDLAPFGETHTRSTTLLLGAERLHLAEAPVRRPLVGGAIELESAPGVPEELPRPILIRGKRPRVVVPAEDRNRREALVRSITVETTTRWVVAMEAGGRIITVAGSPDLFEFLPPRDTDPTIGEVAYVDQVKGTTLRLASPAAAYDIAGVEIWGNVVPATHGESVVAEVLGSGDAARAYQRFELRGTPLTHTPAATPSGGVSTLRVSVNDVVWTEVATLFGSGPRDRVYATGTTEEGRTVVQFGDGVHGARPPTGRDNIRADYRVGTGLAGLAAPEQLSLLLTRPLGVRAVRNPFAASGAQDPEVTADAAENAPRTVLTLDRIVSLRDYADFARNVAGIGKAAAEWTWDGQTRGVALTVAGDRGAALTPTGPVLTNLLRAIRAAGDPQVPLVVLPAELGRVTLQAQLTLAVDRLPQPVLDAARAALLALFSFARRDFGQPIALSEIDRVLHTVPGVLGVHVTRLQRPGGPGIRTPLLPARGLIPGAPPPAEGAEVLVLDPSALVVEVAP